MGGLESIPCYRGLIESSSARGAAPFCLSTETADGAGFPAPSDNYKCFSLNRVSLFLGRSLLSDILRGWVFLDIRIEAFVQDAKGILQLLALLFR